MDVVIEGKIFVGAEICCYRLFGKCHNIVNTFMCHDIVDTLCFLSQIVIKFLDLGFTQKEL